VVLPDIATCPDCLREILDPTNRRYRYPFTNCTNCGPRFSIIEALPYDRANTSMRGFKMCPQCQAEYDDPCDRRFHAQPNACPVCGPRLQLWPARAAVRPGGNSIQRGIVRDAPRNLAEGNDALLAATHVIRCGQIVALKGIGGFHLLVDARNEAAVRRLRERKHREEKPFALMFPSLESVKEVCEVTPLEERLLRSPEAPIVLLRKIVNRKSQIVNAVAPGNPYCGAMLPSNPLHHLLMAELGFPVVATSGNQSDEPICTDEYDAVEYLHGIADVFLIHNRPIVRHVDDSIVRVMLDREMILRRARGYAPLPISLPTSHPVPLPVGRGESGRRSGEGAILAVGAHLKNSVALGVGEQVFISQHIGDLETEAANNAFRRVIADFEKLYEVKPGIVVADLHPDYLSTIFAENATGMGRNPLRAMNGGQRTAQPILIRAQHHISHVLSCMAENELEPPVLGVAWDGTGLGADGTIWGGEFFLVTRNKVERVAHLRPFRLPGGDAAVKEPCRAAIGLLHELAAGDDNLLLHMQQKVACPFADAEEAGIRTMIQRGINAPWTTSTGRLFDAVAAIIGLRRQMRFEGQAAMEMEFALEGIETDEHYELGLVGRLPSLVVDWAPMIHGILADVANGESAGRISAKFHNALAEAVLNVAEEVGERRVALSGGCFQNRYLTERTVKRLRDEGFRPYWHQRVPTNDGGIALGQIVAARRQTDENTRSQTIPSPGQSATLAPSNGGMAGVGAAPLHAAPQLASR
jgi:hydrogenase maturation protein HypF